MQRDSLDKKWATKELITQWANHLAQSNPIQPNPFYLQIRKSLINKILSTPKGGKKKDEATLESLIQEEKELLHAENCREQKGIAGYGIIGNNESFSIIFTGKNIAIAESIHKEVKNKYSILALLAKINLIIAGESPNEVFKDNARLRTLPDFEKNPKLWKGSYLRILLFIYVVKKTINEPNKDIDFLEAEMINISKKELCNLYLYPSEILGALKVSAALDKFEKKETSEASSGKTLLIIDKSALWSSEFYQPTWEDWDNLLVYKPLPLESKHYTINEAITVSPLFKVKNSFFTSSNLILDSLIPWMKNSLINREEKRDDWKAVSESFENEIKNFIEKSTGNFSGSIEESRGKCKGLNEISFGNDKKNHKKLYNEIQQNLTHKPENFPGEIDCFAPILPCDDFNTVKNQSFLLIECKSVVSPGNIKNFIENISPNGKWVQKITQKRKWLNSHGFHNILCLVIVEGVEFDTLGFSAEYPENLIIIDSVSFYSAHQDAIKQIIKDIRR